MNKLNIKQLEGVLYHILSTNKILEEQGKNPISVEIVGEAGIGKTSLVKQIAAKHNLPFIKLNLAQTEELGDLVGFPIKQYEMSDGNQIEWITEVHVEEYTSKGFHSTGEQRMSYCPPEWIVGQEDGGILLLDDYSRSHPRFIQATMELIENQQYLSWKLPKGWTIILTSNPNNGEYLVTSLDEAQATRYLSFNLQFDINCWAEWAELNSVDNRAINFLLMHSELVTDKVNSRAITNFFNAISTIPHFEQELDLITLIGSGSVGNEFVDLFLQFISQKLDKLPTIEFLMTAEEKTVCDTLKKLLYKNGDENEYQSDIASVLITRLINWLIIGVESKQLPTAQIKQCRERIEAIVKNDLISRDLVHHLVSSLFKNHRNSFKELTRNLEAYL